VVWDISEKHVFIITQCLLQRVCLWRMLCNWRGYWMNSCESSLKCKTTSSLSKECTRLITTALTGNLRVLIKGGICAHRRRSGLREQSWSGAGLAFEGRDWIQVFLLSDPQGALTWKTFVLGMRRWHIDLDYLWFSLASLPKSILERKSAVRFYYHWNVPEINMVFL
jgi:hypothetical protein